MTIVRNSWRQSSNDRPQYVKKNIQFLWVKQLESNIFTYLFYLHQRSFLITSWGLACSAKNIKTFLPPSGYNWDYVVLDEAHEIRNHNSNRFKCCWKICSKSPTRRLALTGTPFQNDATELWSIVHMATAGKVLGKVRIFQS
jgi:hypothetical protein